MKKILLVGYSLLLLFACDSSERQIERTNKDKPMDYNVSGQTDVDHLWLEEVEGDRALSKVRSWNERSKKRMQNDTYLAIKAELLEVYHSPKKIPYVSYRAGKAYNFWQDDKHVRGLWRMTTLDSYRTDDPQWETILDMDALAEKEGKNWVYKGVDCLEPEYNFCMLSLSDGGKDAVVLREFDIKNKRFVSLDDHGFVTDESKGSTSWVDKDHLVIGVDFGADSMTDSGYPFISKLWKRGTPLSEARELMRGKKEDVRILSGTFENEDGIKEILILRAITFFDIQYYWIPRSGNKAFKPQQLPLPGKVELTDPFKDQQLITLQEDWRGYQSGALLSFSLADFMLTGKIERLHEVITPNERQSIERVAATRSAVLLSLYENVSGKAYAFDFDGKHWNKKKLDLPGAGSVSIGRTNDKEDIAFVSTENFLSPDTLWQLDTKKLQLNKVKGLPDWFDSTSMQVEQFQVSSTDGTRIPYYVVHHKDMKLEGTNPTLLYGYGGFEISLNPSYSDTLGRAWLARGGVYVLANIRGGGEFGPDWHQAGLKMKRQIVYDDFIAVAEDLIKRKITSPQFLGAHGGSNGGLLMGVMYTQRPDLFKAIACGVPLLDMMRFHKLLAGASWMGEYGDPEDAQEGAFLRTISPYHNVRPRMNYPEIFLYTSTKDDRVHPGHARKFAQRLEDLGYNFLYYENIDGGHSAAANLEETAHSQALIYSYFVSKLMPE
ncbi:MAG: prolyl oligopeptidase family serine peptidase [Thiotrichaceae bacterium]